MMSMLQPAWATAILAGTPSGAGLSNLQVYLGTIFNNTRNFGVAEHAATAIAVTLVQVICGLGVFGQ